MTPPPKTPSGRSDLAKRDPDEPAAWFRSYSASSVGIEIVVATLLGVGAGMWLENNVTHWSPWTMLLGLLVGLGAAGKAVARTIGEYNAASERERVTQTVPPPPPSDALAAPRVGVPPPDTQDAARD